MKNIKVYTKLTNIEGQYRISNIVASDDIRQYNNVFNIVIQALRLKGMPQVNTSNAFAYTFGFKLGG